MTRFSLALLLRPCGRVDWTYEIVMLNERIVARVGSPGAAPFVVMFETLLRVLLTLIVIELVLMMDSHVGFVVL